VLAGLIGTGRLEIVFVLVVAAALAAAVVGLKDWPAREEVEVGY
jgi:hypothetical protein